MRNPAIQAAVLVIFVLAFSAHLRAADVKADPQADKDWEAYSTTLSAQPAKPYSAMSPRESNEWIEHRALNIRSLGLDFIEKHPADPRRWKIIAEFSPNYPAFVKQWGEFNAEGVATNSIIDKEAAAAWKLKVDQLKLALSMADDVPTDLRDQLAVEDALKPFTEAAKAKEKGQVIDLPGLRAKLDDFAAKHPTADAFMMLFYYDFMAQDQDPTALQQQWPVFANSPNASIAKFAKKKVAFLQLAKVPLNIAFTAVDGRAVDLAKLRGKVVLLDFWATWCGPCRAELPNVKKIYEEYHGKGFEVVGVSLEMADVDPKDTPEQSASKLAKAKESLTQFIARQKLPWPQYYDGKGWDNEIAKDYALSGIPTAFLLDQDGQIANFNAQGETLEKDVKRLLKL